MQFPYPLRADCRGARVGRFHQRCVRRSVPLLREGTKDSDMSSRGVPALQGEGGLSRYLTEIRKFPLLEPEEEYMLAKRWREHEDPEAARRLVASHLRLVAKIAMGYRG